MQSASLWREKAWESAARAWFFLQIQKRQGASSEQASGRRGNARQSLSTVQGPSARQLLESKWEVQGLVLDNAWPAIEQRRCVLRARAAAGPDGRALDEHRDGRIRRGAGAEKASITSRSSAAPSQENLPRAADLFGSQHVPRLPAVRAVSEEDQRAAVPWIDAGAESVSAWREPDKGEPGHWGAKEHGRGHARAGLMRRGCGPLTGVSSSLSVQDVQAVVAAGVACCGNGKVDDATVMPSGSIQHTDGKQLSETSK